ncbi:Protein SUPPRESSOR OF GENE SILENCING 3 [Zea mays]|uniref:Protein SUPPRESSOR OF GENE SILENCING 3 n=1 Tax=Zea mays TaxID=4577 RepID=A0A1D6ML83_MAIZE|nr:Protein SUPPRESSOR OF GENE SILENCING 3 [Zea mays]
MGKKLKKPGQAGGRYGSSHPSGTSWAQAPDHGAATRGNPRPPSQTSRHVLTPPLANGWQWQSRPRPSGSEVKKDDAPPSGSVPEVENFDGNNTSDDDDDDLSDDISDDYDSDASEKSFETRKTNKWFKEFFEVLNTLSLEQINEQTRQWHCPACKNGPRAIDWYKGLQPLVTHARTKGSTRVKLHRELAALLEEELSRRGTSVLPAGEQFGKWKGLQESTDREIVWPPMVIVMNTFLEKDEDDKIGRSTKEYTEALNDLLESDDKFGFIIMDGNGTLFVTLSGNTCEVLHRFTVDLPKQHGRGGQSALCFARLRMEKHHNYVRKTAELSTQFFINPATSQPNVVGLILADSANFKTELSQSDMFDQRLEAKILNAVDVSYGGENLFNQAIELSA